MLPTGRGALRQIVQTQCVINWEQHHDPSPCERVVIAGKGSDVGYALLADPDGGAHYLLVPTQTMAGIEGSELLDPDAPNYFADAWHARGLLSKFVGHDVPRGAIGLVVNTVRARPYDQFSIDIGCLRQEVYDSLRQSAEQVMSVWSPLIVGGVTFQATRVASDGLDGANLFELLATLKPDTARHMGDYTLVAAGAQFKGGPGFVVLTGTGPSGEILLDSTCAAAGGGG
jgi:CDP-diacylglycerol pyrophosphatase